MKNSVKFEQAFNYFKTSYSYKMGGTQTVVLPNGKSKYFDDREYYSGRGAKYNSSIKHHEIGDVKVTRKEYSDFLKMLRDREERRLENQKEAAVKAVRIDAAKANGVYSIIEEEYGTYIELSNEESEGRFFDADRLARTLNISVKDALLLKSCGKTYVFAKQKSSDKTIEMYHPDLSANSLSISFSFPSKERILEFDHSEWASAPYAGLVGQTDNKNHFVC